MLTVKNTFCTNQKYEIYLEQVCEIWGSHSGVANIQFASRKAYNNFICECPRNWLVRHYLRYNVIISSPLIVYDGCCVSGCAAQRGLWPPRTTKFRGHTTTRQSVGLLWISNQLVAETSTWQHTQQTNLHAPRGIWTHDRSRRAAVVLHLSIRRLLYKYTLHGINIKC
jgi:hypothetical protein